MPTNVSDQKKTHNQNKKQLQLAVMTVKNKTRSAEKGIE